MGLSPVKIIRILWVKQNHGTAQPEDMSRSVFLLVRRYKPLNRDAEGHDPYRSFGFALAGCLFCAELLDLEIVQVQDVICPFASTSYAKAVFNTTEHSVFGDDLIHVFPIIKVAWRSRDEESD